MVHTQAETRRLVAVVVTYNRIEQLKLVIERLLAAPEMHLQAVMVIDNASDDGTAEWLEAQDDTRLVVERLAANIGGAGGFSTGIERAVETFDPDWLVLMDDDARPAPGALAAFHAQDAEDWDAFGAAVYFPDGQICEMNRPSRNPFTRLGVFFKTLVFRRNGFHIDPDTYNQQEPYEIDVTSFVGFFISRKGIALADLPNPGLFLYGDDAIYTLTLSMRGGRIGFAPKIRFEHDCSTFKTVWGKSFQPLWKVYYYHRNLLILYRQAAGWLFWPLASLLVPYWLLKVIHHGGARAQFLSLMRRALMDGLNRRTDVPHEVVLGWGAER